MIESDNELILRSELNFYPEDIEANRLKQMTERQKDILRSKRYPPVAAWLGIGMIGVFVEILNIAGVVTYSESLCWPIVALGLGVFGVGRAGKVWLDFRDDIQAGYVRKASGIVQLDTARRGQIGRQHFILIDGHVFDVPRQTFLAFRHLDKYHIYFAPSSMTILSAERMDN